MAAPCLFCHWNDPSSILCINYCKTGRYKKNYILCMQNKYIYIYIYLFIYFIFYFYYYFFKNSVLKGKRGNNNWVHMWAHGHMHLPTWAIAAWRSTLSGPTHLAGTPPTSRALSSVTAWPFSWNIGKCTCCSHRWWSWHLSGHILKLSVNSPSVSPPIPSFSGIHKIRKFY